MVIGVCWLCRMYKHRAQFRAKQAGVDLNEVKGGLQPNRQGTGAATRAQDVIVSDTCQQLVAQQEVLLLSRVC